MNKMESLLLIRDGEGRSALFFVLLFVCMGVGVAIGKGSADALFLKRYGVENLAYVYLGLAVVLSLVSTVYTGFVDRVSAERFLFLLFGIQLTALALAWVFMDVLEQSSVYPAYYALYALSAELLVLHGGVYIGQNLNTLQAKRLTSLIFGGYQFGMMLGGLLLINVVADVGLNSAPLAWGVCVLLALFMLAWWHGRHGTSPFYFPQSKRNKSQFKSAVDEVRQGIDFTRRMPLLKNSAFALVFMVITFYMLSYSAHVIYNKTFETEEDLLAFFGLLMIVTNVAAMFFQFFITNRVMVWVGVRRTKFIYPITTILSFILLLVQPGFIAAVFASINRDTFMPAFRVPVRQMFFNVLLEYMKGRARAITVAIITPMALFICGLLILAIQRYGNLSVLLIIGLVLSIVYLYFSVRMGKSYVSTLIDSMKEKLFLPTYSSSVLKDKNIALLEALSRALASSNDLVSLSYAKALMLAYPDKAVDLLLERVRNAKIPAADQMLALVRTAVGKNDVKKLLQCIDQGDAHLQANLYEAVTNYDDGETDALVAELLSSPNERIRASGVKAAFRRELAANKMAAVNIWYKLLAGHRDMQCAALDLIPLMEQYHGLDRDHMVTMYQKCMIDLLSDADEKRKCHIYGLLVNSSKDSRFTASALEALLCLKSKNLVTLLSSLVAGDYELAVRAGAGRVFANVADVYKWCMAQEDRWLRVCGIQAYQTMEE